MPSLPEYVAQLTGLDYDTALAYASGVDTPEAGTEATVVAQALADGWNAAGEAAAAPTIVQDAFAALAADAPSEVAA